MRDDGRALVVYFVTAYAWAWAVFVPLAYFHGPLPWTVLGTMGPTVAAVVASRTVHGSFAAFRLWPGWTRAIGATALGVVLMVVSFAVLPAAATADPRKVHWDALLSLSIYSYSTLLGGPLFEEPGWRGFALPRLEATFGPLRGTVLLGAIWAAWHAPLFFYRGWTSANPLSFLVLVVAQSLLLTFATNLARFSIITPVAMHAMFNTTSGFLGRMFVDTEPHAPLPFELVMGLCGLATAAVLILATRGRLVWEPPTAA